MLALKSGNQFWSYQCLWLLNHMLAEKLVSFCQVEGDIMQILSMHTLQVITIHFTFITAQIGNDCTIKFGVTVRGCETMIYHVCYLKINELRPRVTFSSVKNSIVRLVLSS